MDLDAHIATRRSLHGVAELLLAGPQHAANGDIRLRVVPGGFGTVTKPTVAVVGADIVREDTRIALDGKTVRDVAVELGLELQDLAHVYSDVSDLDPDVQLTVDRAAAERICAGYVDGDAALRAFAPSEEPILWPEHFDLAIRLDEVNYGVTPGDSGIETPYMYVGPWPVPAGEFWNESFGAARPLPNSAEAIRAFFDQGRELLTR